MFLFSQTWMLLKSAVNCFIEDEALTRGAAIAFYTATIPCSQKLISAVRARPRRRAKAAANHAVARALSQRWVFALAKSS